MSRCWRSPAGPPPLKDPEFINAADVVPVQRLLQATTVINEHDDDGPSVKPGPLDGGGRLLLPLQGVQGLLHKVVQSIVLQAEVDAMLDGLLRRGVYNLGKQAVVLILDRELGVRDDGSATNS